MRTAWTSRGQERRGEGGSKGRTDRARSLDAVIANLESKRKGARKVLVGVVWSEFIVDVIGFPRWGRGCVGRRQYTDTSSCRRFPSVNCMPWGGNVWKMS